MTDKEKRYQCKSGIQLTDTLYFEYAFPRVNFWKHEEYQEKIRQRLLSFIDKSQREQVREQAYGYLQ